MLGPWTGFSKCLERWSTRTLSTISKCKGMKTAARFQRRFRVKPAQRKSTALVKKIRPDVEPLKDLLTGAADVLENSAMLRRGVAWGDLTVVKALYKLNTGEQDLRVSLAIAPPGQEGWREAPGWWINHRNLSS